MKKRKLLALCLVPALLAGCAAPAGVTDLSRQKILTILTNPLFQRFL